MYLEHFGLDRPPFKITPDTSLFFEGSQRGAALGALIYAIKNGEGIIKVVGEVGSGKTMLCRMLEVKLTGDVDIIYIANPSLSPDNILHVIAHELGLDISTDTSKLEVMQKIQNYLLRKHADNRQVVMFVEEAQSMPVETLEEVRLLSNLETDQNKLLQMVLFGQPELDEKLSQNHIRQLKERITHSFYLAPFLPKDTFEYLNFRMRAVGYRGPDIFNHKTAGRVKKYSNGLTRRINILADKSLLASFSEGKHEVTVKHVKIAAKDSDFEKNGNNRKLIYGAMLLTGLVLAVWFGMILANMGISSRLGLNAVTQAPAQIGDTKVMPVDEYKMQAMASQTRAAEVADDVNIKNDLNQPLTKSEMDNNVAGVVRDMDINVESQTSVNTVSAIKKQQVASQINESDNLIESRISATEKWLTEVENKNYSIQLFLVAADGMNALSEFLGNVPESLDYNKIYIYETVIKNNPVHSVIYDDFSSYSKAVQVLKGLTDDFQLSKPFIRRVSDLRPVSNAKKSDATQKPEAANASVTLNNLVA